MSRYNKIFHNAAQIGHCNWDIGGIDRPGLTCFLFFPCSAMLEPSPRYAGAGGTGGASAGSALQIDTGGGHHNHLETAVDLSRKAAGKSPASADNGAPAGQTDLDAEQEDSEDEAPLDLKVSICINIS